MSSYFECTASDLQDKILEQISVTILIGQTIIRDQIVLYRIVLGLCDALTERERERKKREREPTL